MTDRCRDCGGWIIWRTEFGQRKPVHLTGGCHPREGSGSPRLGDSADEARTFATYCPWCSAECFYHTNGNGDAVYLDALGWPWPIHPCYEEHRHERATGGRGSSGRARAFTPSAALEGVGTAVEVHGTTTAHVTVRLLNGTTRAVVLRRMSYVPQPGDILNLERLDQKVAHARHHWRLQSGIGILPAHSAAGIAVSNIVIGWPAVAARVAADDLILRINGVPVAGSAGIPALYRAVQSNRPMELDLRRGSGELQVRLQPVRKFVDLCFGRFDWGKFA